MYLIDGHFYKVCQHNYGYKTLRSYFVNAREQENVQYKC
jgi:hypothetical protein